MRDLIYKASFMATVKQLCDEMSKVAADLISNATTLLELSKSPDPMEEIKEYQEKQEELVEVLLALDKEIHGLADSEADLSGFWKDIVNKIDIFQQMNESFVSNLSIRKGLIRFEVNDLRRTRKNLNSVKKVYVKKTENKSRKSNGKINTLS